MFLDDNDFTYQPNDIDSEIFLSEVPLSLLKENIIAQFENPLEYRKKDYIASFIKTYKYSKEQVDLDDDEDVENLNQLRDDFYSFMLKIFDKFLGIGLIDFEEKSDEKQNEIIHFVYRFFITNIKKNFVYFVLNSINSRKEEYRALNEEEKRKDVTTLSFKKEVTDDVDIYILSNLSTIIDNILHDDDIEIDDFLDNCDVEDCLETRFVKKLWDKDKMTGNFIFKYVDMLDYDFISEIESKVRNKILKKYA